MISAEEALERLKRGNELYRASGSFTGRIDAGIRGELAAAQHPYAVIVSCSDSRVVPEAIFSAGLGELFVIRVAGNVVAEQVLGSVQYAHEHLGCNLAVVLGHSGCGAVHAAVEGGADGYTAELIRPIREAAHDCTDERCVAIANARAGAERIRSEFPKSDLKVLPALYNIESGEVAWL